MLKKSKKKLTYNKLFNHSEKLAKKIKINNINIKSNNKKILITGASGNLGFNIAKNLSKKNCIVVLFRKENENIKKLKKIKNIVFIKTKGIECKFLGIDKEKYLDLATNITDIYHCAALISNSVSFIKIYRTNVKGFLNILKFSQKKYSKNIEYISTLSVNISYKNYTNNELIKPEFLKKDSYSNLIPQNYYTATKIINEVILYKLKDQINFNIYRLGLLFNDKLDINSYVYILLKELKNKQKIIKGYENYSFDYTPYNFAVKEIVNNSSNKKIKNVSLNKKITLKMIQKVLKLDLVNSEEYPKYSWLKKLLLNDNHTIFEMTKIKGFIVDKNNYKVDLNEVINEWYKDI